MVKPAFAFKQFEVMHHQSTMKVGTDAVLLGSWVAATDPKKILDEMSAVTLSPHNIILYAK